MTRDSIGLGFTGLVGIVALIVLLSGRDDWWGGPAIGAVIVVLYWSLRSVLFDGSSA